MCQVAMPKCRFLNTIADSQLLVVRHRQQFGSIIDNKCNLCQLQPAHIHLILLRNRQGEKTPWPVGSSVGAKASWGLRVSVCGEKKYSVLKQKLRYGERGEAPPPELRWAVQLPSWGMQQMLSVNEDCWNYDVCATGGERFGWHTNQFIKLLYTYAKLSLFLLRPQTYNPLNSLFRKSMENPEYRKFQTH